MYPNFYYLFQDLFGVEWPFLIYVNSFGFFVAMSFLITSWVMSLELKRLEAEGSLVAKIEETKVGVNAGVLDYVINGILGFIVGWKFVYLIMNSSEFMDDPQSHILSREGSIPLGLLVAAIALVVKYYEDQKEKKKHPEVKIIKVKKHPFEHMGMITLVAAVCGFIGAKLFDHLEHWDEFVKNPLAAFLDPFSGLTFFGGLILGGAGVLWYAQRQGIHWRKMLDVGGPAMMLAYALGRIGCQVSGDGDWGIVNQKAMPSVISWLPDWMWSYNYPNNVARICDPFTSGRCLNGQEVVLSAPVWPTPFYETVACLVLFGLLWSIRKKVSVPGVLFSIYLVLAGLERFFIEKIRVNIKYHFGSLDITQAELISFAMILLGLFGIWYFKVKKPTISSENLQ